MYKDKLNYKAPGAGGYVAHQDGYHGLGVPQYTSRHDRGFIAYVCMVAVDASTAANGCPEVGWGCWQRKEGWVGANVDGGEGDVDPLKIPEDAMAPFQKVEMDAGDVLIYDKYARRHCALLRRYARAARVRARLC